jgi:3-methyladenine DNA glycosylase AlkD
MRESYREGVASHPGPEPCEGGRKAALEALDRGICRLGKRAGFALMAGLAVHDKPATDRAFIKLLPLIENAASDHRNFVKKAVNWALRNIGKRNRALNAAAIACAERIRAAADRRADGTRAGDLAGRSARWVATDALRELRSDRVQARLKD